MIRLLFSVVASFSLTALVAQTNAPSTPKLVVAITIDQLRGDYLNMFKGTFGENGFKRLLNEGLVYSGVSYDFPNIDKATSTTTVFTGTNPSYHGIIGEEKYVKKTGKVVSSFHDDTFSGHHTTQKVSPMPIRVSTIADELKSATDGQADVFAFAPDAASAIAAGGHNANVVYWIDDQSGKWCTSSFYKDKQPFVEQQNRGALSISARISDTAWRPALETSQYNAFPYTKNRYGFQHYFAADQKNKIRLFKQSPLVNTEIREIAEKIMLAKDMGKRENPDLLSVTFYAGNYKNARDKIYSVEIQDTYHRLDAELAKLIETIDKHIGLQNALIFVVPTGSFLEQPNEDNNKFTDVGGTFLHERNKALLNMYLMAIYGQGQWVEKYIDNQIYLNLKRVEEKKIDTKELLEKASDFLLQSSGIHNVVTSRQMLFDTNSNSEIQHFRNGYYRGISGDLIYELQPGWQNISENHTKPSQRSFNSALHTPVIFLGNNISPQKVERVIHAQEIAPSVAYRLRIRAPNAAKSTILKEMH